MRRGLELQHYLDAVGLGALPADSPNQVADAQCQPACDVLGGQLCGQPGVPVQQGVQPWPEANPHQLPQHSELHQHRPQSAVEDHRLASPARSSADRPGGRAEGYILPTGPCSLPPPYYAPLVEPERSGVANSVGCEVAGCTAYPFPDQTSLHRATEQELAIQYQESKARTLPRQPVIFSKRLRHYSCVCWQKASVALGSVNGGLRPPLRLAAKVAACEGATGSGSVSVTTGATECSSTDEHSPAFSMPCGGPGRWTAQKIMSLL